MLKESYKDLEFIFDEENGTTVCQMMYDKKPFYGNSTCAPEDMDMLSKKTGQEIAFNRASIQVLRYEKMRLNIELKALKSLYYSINTSKRYNPKSYEATMLKRQMDMRENDIAQLTADIREIQNHITSYINEKDKFYKELRKIRERQTQDNKN